MSVELAAGSGWALDVRPASPAEAGGAREVWVRFYGELPCSWTVTFRAAGGG